MIVGTTVTLNVLPRYKRDRINGELSIKHDDMRRYSPASVYSQVKETEVNTASLASPGILFVLEREGMKPNYRAEGDLQWIEETAMKLDVKYVVFHGQKSFKEKNREQIIELTKQVLSSYRFKPLWETFDGRRRVLSNPEEIAKHDFEICYDVVHLGLETPVNHAEMINRYPVREVHLSNVCERKDFHPETTTDKRIKGLYDKGNKRFIQHLSPFHPQGSIDMEKLLRSIQRDDIMFFTEYMPPYTKDERMADLEKLKGLLSDRINK